MHTGAPPKRARRSPAAMEPPQFFSRLRPGGLRGQRPELPARAARRRGIRIAATTPAPPQAPAAITPPEDMPSIEVIRRMVTVDTRHVTKTMPISSASSSPWCSRQASATRLRPGRERSSARPRLHVRQLRERDLRLAGVHQRGRDREIGDREAVADDVVLPSRRLFSTAPNRRKPESPSSILRGSGSPTRACP